jgi:DNA-binding MarR family transcriptional regulator
VPATPEPRELRDARSLRAVAHPLRLTLLELLERRGTLTSAEASLETGESTGSCSFHLRQLAKYGFIEAVPGRDGRERRWARATAGERVPARLDDESTRAGTELGKLLVDRFAGEARRWIERRDDVPGEWEEGAVFDLELLYLTPSELRALSSAVVELFAGYRGRTTELATRPKDAGPVRAAAVLFALPDQVGPSSGR